MVDTKILKNVICLQICAWTFTAAQDSFFIIEANNRSAEAENKNRHMLI